MAPSTADPEGEDFTDDYITSRQRWLAIGFGGVVAGLIASGVGILWNERESPSSKKGKRAKILISLARADQIWFRSWCGGMLLCNLILLGLLVRAFPPPSARSNSFSRSQIFLRKALSPPSSIHKAQALRYSLLVCYHFY